MKMHRLAIVLTIVNLALLIFILVRLRPFSAPDASQVLRGRALEIVDDQGRMRAQIIVTTPTTMPDGQTYPETSLLRLIDPNGRPAVKIGASVDGTAVSLAGDSEHREWSGVQILSKAEGSSIIVTNRDGRVQEITPK